MNGMRLALRSVSIARRNHFDGYITSNTRMRLRFPLPIMRRSYMEPR